ncbi:MAG: Transcriptional regulator AcuR [Stenotrophomonas maltophilia]|nr:MAG: Transcriptional regulator AcuR [Stenotrophomonas maltophilia]
MQILTEQGFAATGIEQVLKQVQVPKGSFYHYFESKEAFGQAVLARYAEYFAGKLERSLNATDRPPLQRLQAFVDDARAGMARHAFRRGCLVGNLGQEVLVLPDSFRAQLEAILQDWERRLALCLEAAVAEGELAAGSDCQALAGFFWISWEGAVLRARLVQNDAPLQTFFAGFVAGLPR